MGFEEGCVGPGAQPSLVPLPLPAGKEKPSSSRLSSRSVYTYQRCLAPQPPSRCRGRFKQWAFHSQRASTTRSPCGGLRQRGEVGSVGQERSEGSGKPPWVHALGSEAAESAKRGLGTAFWCVRIHPLGLALLWLEQVGWGALGDALRDGSHHILAQHRSPAPAVDSVHLPAL